MEFSKTIFQAWKVMENRQGHGKLWKIMEFGKNARYSLSALPPPFPQIDIIGDVVIVWRVRGKTIRSVLCNSVCNNCAQCNAHTYEQI